MFMWFAHGCLRFVAWQLCVLEALTLMMLVCTLKRLKPVGAAFLRGRGQLSLAD